MPFNLSPDEREALQSAREHLLSALNILDDVGAPADLGAHVDLAVEGISAQLAGPDLLFQHLFG